LKKTTILLLAFTWGCCYGYTWFWYANFQWWTQIFVRRFHCSLSFLLLHILCRIMFQCFLTLY